MIADIFKIFLPAVLSFVVGIGMTSILTNYLYKYKCWKKKSGKTEDTPIFNSLHKEREVNTPRMGGIVVWGSAAFTILGIWLVSQLLPTDLAIKLDFLSRNQTWIPLSTLLLGALIGLLDDYMEIKGNGDNKAGGLSLKKRLFLVGVISLAVALWFYLKLDVESLGMPALLGEVYLGPLFVLFFVILTLFIYAGGVIDGLDGLAGGVFATIFGAYGVIAYYQNQIDLAAFCAAIAGALLAFLWFNIPPARYYMSETGTMGLTITLTVVAFMTDKLGDGYGVLILPIIALPLVITVLSNLIQVLSKRIRGKKVFLVAPIHHHFEAIGWPAYKVTMRYWIFTVVCALLGITLALIR